MGGKISKVDLLLYMKKRVMQKLKCTLDEGKGLVEIYIIMRA